MIKFCKKIYDFFRYDLPYGIDNLVVWFPIVWRDRQWGDRNIFIILRHKLYLTSENFKNSEIESSIEDSKDMDVCIDILDRLIHDKHHDKAFGEFYQKWGHPDLKFNEEEKASVVYPNAKNEVERIECDSDFSKACKNKEFIVKNDLDMLFRILKGNIRQWWD